MVTTPILDRLSTMASAIGSQAFGTALYGLFRDTFDIDECTVFAFPDPQHPQSVIIEGSCDKTRDFARKLARDYIAEGHLTDPLIQQARPFDGIDIYVIRTDEIDDSSYRQHYFEQSDIAQKLVVQGFVDGALYYVSLYSKSGHSLGNGDVSVLRPLASLIVKSLHRHNQLVELQVGCRSDVAPFTTESPSALRQRTMDHMREVILAGEGKLSRREAEVCAGIVMGYSTTAIALNSSISTNTVATHRKRIFTKLGITSQNELFVRYFPAVRAFQARQAH